MKQFRIIPYYTGDDTLEEVLKNPKAISLLWLEVLFNDTFSWEDHLDHPQVRAAYEKACVWYGRFKTMVQGHTGRRPLETMQGEIDEREYRKFQKALYFVSSRS